MLYLLLYILKCMINLLDFYKRNAILITIYFEMFDKSVRLLWKKCCACTLCSSFGTQNIYQDSTKDVPYIYIGQSWYIFWPILVCFDIFDG